eukprot:6088677-Pyramimonas_sp.AAC.1
MVAVLIGSRAHVRHANSAFRRECGFTLRSLRPSRILPVVLHAGDMAARSKCLCFGCLEESLNSAMPSSLEISREEEGPVFRMLDTVWDVHDSHIAISYHDINAEFVTGASDLQTPTRLLHWWKKSAPPNSDAYTCAHGRIARAQHARGHAGHELQA